MVLYHDNLLKDNEYKIDILIIDNKYDEVYKTGIVNYLHCTHRWWSLLLLQVNGPLSVCAGAQLIPYPGLNRNYIEAMALPIGPKWSAGQCYCG